MRIKGVTQPWVLINIRAVLHAIFLNLYYILELKILFDPKSELTSGFGTMEAHDHILPEYLLMAINP